MLPVCDDDTDVAGVPAYNNLEKVGRIHLYSQFSGESPPENLKKRHILLHLNSFRPEPHRKPSVEARGAAGRVHQWPVPRLLGH